MSVPSEGPSLHQLLETTVTKALLNGEELTITPDAEFSRGATLDGLNERVMSGVREGKFSVDEVLQLFAIGEVLAASEALNGAAAYHYNRRMFESLARNLGAGCGSKVKMTMMIWDDGTPRGRPIYTELFEVGGQEYVIDRTDRELKVVPRTSLHVQMRPIEGAAQE